MVSESIFIFWEVKYVFCSTKSSATNEKAIVSRLPVSSETVTGSIYLERVRILYFPGEGEAEGHSDL
jgi:hypothetical protein